MSANETLYIVSNVDPASPEQLAASAERRARERGCECFVPVFVHILHMDADGTCCHVYVHVDHTSPACPLRPSAVSS